MNIIAIDCGASFVKFALFEDEKLIETKQIASPAVTAETDIFNTKRIESLVHIVQQGLEHYLSEVHEATLCIDSEMHGFILAYADGKPYTDYLSWQLELIESDEVMHQLKDIIGQDKCNEFIKRSGMPLRSGLPSSSLLWMSRNAFLNSEKPLYFYTLGDYLIRKLTGKEPICHPTNAASTGLFDLETGNWNQEYIRALTNNATIIFPSIGKASNKLDYQGKKISVLPAIGDQQAALLGSGFKNTSELSFNMGTGAQVSRLLKGELEYGNYQIRPYFYGYRLKTIPHIPSGRAINVFFRFFRDILTKFDNTISDETIWNWMHDTVSETSIEESTIVCDLSFFENAITDQISGKLTNITEHEFNATNLLGSVFKQMIINFVTVTNRINEGMEGYTSIIFSGGIAKRWEMLRKGIVEKLETDATVFVSDNDTLYGCMKYAQMDDGDR